MASSRPGPGPSRKRSKVHTTRIRRVRDAFQLVCAAGDTERVTRTIRRRRGGDGDGDDGDADADADADAIDTSELTDDDWTSMLNCGFRTVAKHGHVHLVSAIAQLDGVDPASLGNHALRVSCRHGHADTVRFLLSLPADAGIDPTVRSHEALRHAVVDDVSTALVLIADARTDVVFGSHVPIRTACRLGHVRIVDALLRRCPRHLDLDLDLERRERRGVALSDALEHACRNGHVDVVDRMLRDARVVPSTSALMTAVRAGHADVVARLMRDARVLDTVNARDSYAFRHAMATASNASMSDRASNVSPQLAVLDVLLAHDGLDVMAGIRLLPVGTMSPRVAERVLAHPRVEWTVALTHQLTHGRWGNVTATPLLDVLASKRRAADHEPTLAERVAAHRRQLVRTMRALTTPASATPTYGVCRDVVQHVVCAFVMGLTLDELRLRAAAATATRVVYRLTY
jgi:hypothetical protein